MITYSVCVEIVEGACLMVTSHFSWFDIVVNVVTDKFVSLQGWRTGAYFWAKELINVNS